MAVMLSGCGQCSTLRGKQGLAPLPRSWQQDMWRRVLGHGSGVLLGVHKIFKAHYNVSVDQLHVVRVVLSVSQVNYVFPTCHQKSFSLNVSLNSSMGAVWTWITVITV